MHPEHGGRVVLDLDLVRDDEVVYRVALFDPKSVWKGSATLAMEGGAVSFAEWEPSAPPQWIVKIARGFLRSIWSASRKTPAPPWPRRVMRWRAAPGRA